MVHIIKTPLAVAVLLSLTLAVGQARAEVYYTFSGVLPGDATIVLDPNDPNMWDDEGNPLVGVGDRWTVTLTIDPTVEQWDYLHPDDDDPTNGVYDFAVLHAVVSFEGTGAGYSATLVPDDSYVEVFNDYDWSFGTVEDYVLQDGINTETLQGLTSLYMEISTQTANPLSSDALPLSEMFTNNSDIELLSLDFGNNVWNPEASDYWQISYFSASGETFQAVPEPSTILLWCFAAAGLGFVGWRKRRAA